LDCLSRAVAYSSTNFPPSQDIKGGKGEVDALFINTEFPKPTAGDGQAIVKIKAFGINRMDIVQRRGFYPYFRIQPDYPTG
jgi:NADPH:quinone reductase-like Zn-dependent oxidoreductase